MSATGRQRHGAAPRPAPNWRLVWQPGWRLSAGRRRVSAWAVGQASDLAVGLAFCMALGAAFSAGAAPADCGAPLAGPARQVAEGGGLTVVFAPRPWPVPVGRHFALDIAVCAATGSAVPASLRVDADMPAHRHGMNYKPTVQALGDGRFVAEGLMFHMPGRWRFLFYPPAGAPVTLEITTP